MAITGAQPAYSMAQGGVMRGASSRGNVHSTKVFVAIGGVHYATGRAVDAQRVVDETFAIQETEGATANTCSFQVKGFQPTDGQEVIVTMGSKNTLDRWFAGTILTDAHGYVGTPANFRDQVNVIDYTWQLTRDTITQRWTNVSGTVIAQAILAHANRGFSSRYVAAALPVVDEFTVTNQTHAAALSALCDRIGGYWKTTYRSTIAGMRADVRLGLTSDTSQTDPTTLTLASAQLTGLANFSVTRDLSQVITRQPVEGGGVTALTDVAIGETSLPVADEAWYNPAGGTVVSGPQRLTYTGVQPGGGGGLVGPGAYPSAAPAATVAPSAGSVDTGLHAYAATFTTPAGESLPGPTVTVRTNATALTPPAAPGVAVIIGAGNVPVEELWWASTFVTAIGESLPTTFGTNIHNFSPTSYTISPQVGPAGTIARKVYRSTGTVSPVQYKLVGTIPDNVTVSLVDNLADGSLGANAPTVDTTVGQTVSLTAIPIGAASVTSRKLYRTAAGGTQLKLLATIADNTTTIYSDTIADGSLGANVPTVDASGLVQPSGQAIAGSTSLVVAGTAPFSSTGGWAVIGNGKQAIRYTGKTSTTLTGIPATGTGSITASISYNSTITVSAALTGIPASGAGSILYGIKQGDPVNLRVVIDDLPAQAVITALMLPTVDDGIIEGQVIQDGRISETEARARGTAQLALRSAIDVAISYDTRDKNTHAMRTIGVNLGAPTSVVASFKLQQVTIDHFHPAQWPTCHAHGANKRFTLQDLLRVARGA